tara:strand:- start:21 stop:353 length:333 start_codon:yes stop_codon:yes gene_type:complete
MVDYNNIITPSGVEKVEIVGEELTELQAKRTAWNNASVDRKLAQIKQMRLERLQETDYLANSDVTMPDNVKTWRQTLRDLPANHTDEAAYDALLARDSDGNLTNSVWSKP